MSRRLSVYPISMLLEGARCLVVGAGRIALPKIEGLLDAGATVTVVAPTTPLELPEGPITLWRRPFRPGDVAGFRLVVAATGEEAVDLEVAADARAHGVLVNAADRPEACDFYLPAILRRGEVTIAVSTAGASPAVASWVRAAIGEAIGPELAEVVEIVGATRASLRASGRSSEGRPWPELIESVSGALRAGDPVAARALAASWLEELGRSDRSVERPGTGATGE